MYFAVRIGNGILNIATLAIFTRLLSPSEFGAYALGISISTVMSTTLFQWIGMAHSRFYNPNSEDSSEIISVVANGFWIAFGFAAIIFLAMASIHTVLGVSPEMIGIIFLITVSLGRHTLALQIANTNNSLLAYGGLSWLKSASALLFGFVLIQSGVFSATGALVGLLIGLIFAVIIFDPNPGLYLKRGKVDQSIFKNMISYGLPLTLNYLAIVIVDFADRLMIGVMLGMGHVAAYSVAYDLTQQLIGPVMSVLFLTAFPKIVLVYENEGDKASRLLLNILGSRLVVIGLPITVGLGVLAGEVSEVIFGSEFSSDAASVMPWIALAIFLATFKNYFLDVPFQLRKNTKIQVYIATLMAIVNIILNLFLLPRFGVISAAWSTFAAFSVGAIASWLIGKLLFPLPDLRLVFFGSFGASALMAVFLHLLPPAEGFIWLIGKVIVGTFIYGTLAWLFNLAGSLNQMKA